MLPRSSEVHRKAPLDMARSCTFDITISLPWWSALRRASSSSSLLFLLGKSCNDVRSPRTALSL